MTYEESPNGKPLWYAGRFARRRGSFGEVDVLVSGTDEGWQPVQDRKKLFPKSGQAEITGIPAFTLRPGDWLAFQLIKNPRPHAVSLSVSGHRLMPHYLDMTVLGSVEAARSFFSIEGWATDGNPGHWAIRFAEDRILVLDLVRGKDDKLRTMPSSLQHVSSYAFNGACVISEPGNFNPVYLYDLEDVIPTADYDWSTDADYIAHVVRALAGDKDRRLDELIVWLELHRDESTGRVSATGADSDKAYEAIRSGELARRLKTDKAVMAAYLSAVRDDPVIAQIVSEAAAQNTERERKDVAIAMRSEFASEYERKREQQDQELKNRGSALEDALEQRIAERRVQLERELRDKVAALEQEAEMQAASKNKVLIAETTSLTRGRDLILEERARLRTETDQLAKNITELNDKRHLAEEEVSRLSSIISAMSPRVVTPTRTFVNLPALDSIGSTVLPIEGLAREISRTALLTSHGKALMEEFATLMLAGEFPILEGEQVGDFVLVAEALMAANRLVPFDVDATILTPEDIWSRPGSGIASQVAEASDQAKGGGVTLLIQLRGIERSAAHAWFPALAALTRRGLLPRRLMFFATVIDPEADEAKALPSDVCRLRVEKSIPPGAWLVAPSVLGSGPASIAFQLDPGDRERNLSPSLAVFSELGAEANVAMSLRIARVALEALRLRPGDQPAALAAARKFCSAVGMGLPGQRYESGGRENA